ncbi:MAG: hypothetical protein ABSC65_29730 [Acidobacteriaceae bacterium]
MTAGGYLLAASPMLFGAAATATTTGSTGTSAASLLNQLSTAFSGGNPVHQVQLTGNASWHAGSINDTGSATLSAATTGSSQLQLSLSSSGTRIEAESGLGTNLTCSWSGEDAVAHTIDSGNCWRPVVWFLPPLSLQPSLLPSYLGAVDLGSGTVGFGTATYRHLQGELVFPSLTGTLASDIMQRSTADLGLDPATFLPAVLSYSIRPDNGAPIPIAIEIHYSNYQAVNGVQIPFTIQRYVNGSLQLEISVSSAQVN